MLEITNKKMLAGLLAVGIALSGTACNNKKNDDGKIDSSISEGEYPLTEDISDDSSMTDVNSKEYTKAIMALQDVNIRDDMSMDSNILGTLLSGEDLVKAGEKQGEWYPVFYQRRICYVHESCVTEINLIEANYYDNVYVNQDTSFYDAETMNFVDVIPKYQTSRVCDMIDDLYLIKYNDKYGWVSKRDCRVLNGNYVVVDITDQTLDMYQNNNRILETHIVSGKDSTPSDIGLFHIYDKATDVVLYGDDYETPVTYWMPYNGGEGLHDAYWRYEYGGEIYHYDGSHGCINMDISDAKVLYNTLKVGDKVLVKE